MNKFPKNFIIFDTEFTAWKGSNNRNWSKKNEYKELVQIGALKIEKINKNSKQKLKIVDKLSIFIKPKINPILSEYFIELTGITQKYIENKGVSLSKALSLFYKFSKDDKGNNIPLYSYGNDYEIISINLKLNNTPKKSKFYKWKKNFNDLTPIFAKYINVNKYSSGNIYKAFNIVPPKSKINIHNSLWDSISLYLSLNHLFSV